jgi:hypothetical protein
MNVKGSSGRTAARRAPSSSAERERPRSRTSSSVIAPSARTPEEAPFDIGLPVGGSITMIVRRPGSLWRMAATFSSCSSFSQTIAQASESEITHRHSSGELVW